MKKKKSKPPSVAVELAKTGQQVIDALLKKFKKYPKDNGNEIH